MLWNHNWRRATFSPGASHWPACQKELASAVRPRLHGSRNLDLSGAYQFEENRVLGSIIDAVDIPV